MDTGKIRELAQIMEEFGLTSLEMQEGDRIIQLEKKQEMVYGGLPPQIGMNPSFSESASPAGGQGVLRPEREKGIEVKTPMVGVFYGAPSPESDPFVTVGSRVKQGDVLCIIEAMKLMNEITSEFDGIITELCVENGEVVEAGQPIFRMEIEE